jgi:hypothetical protein
VGQKKSGKSVSSSLGIWVGFPYPIGNNSIARLDGREIGEKMHRNLIKAADAYPAQLKHFRFVTRPHWHRYDLYSAEMPGEAKMRRICAGLRVEESDLLGTTCRGYECAQWHTDPGDR